MSQLFYDPKAPKEERAFQLMALGEEGGEDNLQLLESSLRDSDPYLRSAASLALGHFDDKNHPVARDRRVCSFLENMLRDPEHHVRADAILAMGESGDSRVLFTLANYYESATTEIKERVLLALYTLRDPRSQEFLREFARTEKNNVLIQLATRALTKIDTSSRFSYTYHGNEETRKEAEVATGMTVVKTYDDIAAMDEILNDDLRQSHFKPQTYIVTTDGDLVLGGYRNEHVEVAKGLPVLAAGEAGLIKNGDKWVISYLNNRSNGYYPSATCYVHVRKALESTGVDFPNAFTETFPKDGYFDLDFLCTQPFFRFHIKR